MDLTKFSRDDWIVVGLAALLAIDLLFLPWWSVTRGLVFANTASDTATGAPDGWLGVLAVLATLALLADLVLDRLGRTELPTFGGSRASTRFMFAFGAAVCVAFKFILHVGFTATYWDVGFWAAVVLVTGLFMVSRRELREESVATGRAGRTP